MSTSSESAEEFMKFYMDGTYYTLRIAGSAIKNIIAALYVISKDRKKQSSKGRTRLGNMLRSGKELKIFSVKKSDMPVFAKEAKSYGVLYCALVSKSNKNFDDMIDIMVRAEDAPMVNRIIERYKLNTVDKATIKSEIQKEIAEKSEQRDDVPDKGVEETSINDAMIDDIFSKPIQKEENENPLEAKTEKSPPLEHSSMSKNNSEGVTKPAEKKSVKKELEEIKAEQKVETELKEAGKTKDITIQSPIKTNNKKKEVKSK